jgi:urease gamma subunit
MILKKEMDAANHIITVSNLTRNIVIEKYFQDPKKVTTVHNAVEPFLMLILMLKHREATKS